ncbi:MAG: ATP-binding protein [Fusobacteriaceae bacterium]|jgi:serine/threonine-protein kinase RsbW|nr:ATP-binding protein [Fusobacteriaceae bacterium]
MERNEIKLTIPSSLKNISLIRAMIKAYLEHEHIAKNDSFQLLTVVDELSTNVVEHGYKYNMGNIIISIIKNKDVISLTVEDNGVGFDDSKLSKENGGLGLQIARNIADSFIIEKKENGTIFKLVKKIQEVL